MIPVGIVTYMESSMASSLSCLLARVNQYPRVHHPLDAQYDSVVDAYWVQQLSIFVDIEAI